MIGVIVFGMGRFGKEHLSAWEQTGRSRVEVIVDPHHSGSVVTRPGTSEVIPVVADIASIPPDVDAAVAAVVTPVWTHRALAEELVRRKIPFLIEKPLAATIDDAVAIRNLVAESGVLVVPGHLLRFSDLHRNVFDEMARRGFPRVSLRLRRDRSKALLSLYPGEHPALLTGIHDIDLALWLTGSPIAEVSATHELHNSIPVGFQATLTHDNGSVSEISGRYAFSSDTPDRVSDEIHLRSEHGEDYAHHVVEAEEPITPPSPSESPLVREISHFLDLVNGVTTTPVVNLDDAVQCLQVVEAIIQSSESKGSPVTVRPLETSSS